MRTYWHFNPQNELESERSYVIWVLVILSFTHVTFQRTIMLLVVIRVVIIT
jgi:hypothetical protein